MLRACAKVPVAVVLWGLLLVAAPAAACAADSDYAHATRGTLCFGQNCAFKILLDETNLGSAELEMVEMNFSVGYEGKSHPHGSMEVFYVLSGRFGHEVNGEFHVLEPGMVGVVKPGDEVRHSVVGDDPVKVLAIWVPGGEATRVFDRERGTPVE